MMELLAKLGAEGRTILFSSHILEEVERLSGTIQVMVAERLAASGDFRAIRRLMTSRPHVFTVRSSDDRRLARAARRPPVHHRGRAHGQGPAGADQRLRRLLRADRGAHQGPRASRCANCCRPTNRWRASSATSSRAKGANRHVGLLQPDDRRAHRPGDAGPQARAPVRDPGHDPHRPHRWCCGRHGQRTGVDVLWPDRVLGDFGFSVLLPLTALIVGTGVLGAEIDDGSAIHLLATPVRRGIGRADQVRGRGGGDGAVRRRARAGGRPARPRPRRARGRAVRRRPGRLGDLQRGVRAGVGADHPRDRVRPALRADLGGPARATWSAAPASSRSRTTASASPTPSTRTRTSTRASRSPPR